MTTLAKVFLTFTSSDSIKHSVVKTILSAIISIFRLRHALNSRLALTLPFICFFASEISAQELKSVKGESVYTAPSTMSIFEAKRIAMERAQIDAIEKEFGADIIQSNTTFTTNFNGKSNTNFASIGLSDIKAEWIETTNGPKFEVEIVGDIIKISCAIEGKARKSGHRIDFETALLRNSPVLRHSSNEFMHGDDIYLYFKAPESGYINIFVKDENTDKVFCLIPYQDSKLSTCSVQRDKEYIFFDNEEFGYVALTTMPEEINDLIVVYSPTQFSTPYMDERGERNRLQNLTCEHFNKWLSKIRIQNPDINVHIEPIKIKRQ